MRMTERATRTLLVSLALSIFSFFPTAYAQCSDTAYWSVGGPYILKDVGIVEAEGVNTQDGYTRTCGKLSFDVWVSFGEPDAAKEVDFSVFYDTEEGPWKLQLGAQYYALNLRGDSLLDARDDIVNLFADASYPLTLGPVTVAPLVRVIGMVGLGDIDSQLLIQPGVRASIEPVAGFTLAADVRDSMNLTNGGAHVRTAASATWAASDQLSFNVSYGDTDRTPHAFYVGGAMKF